MQPVEIRCPACRHPIKLNPHAMREGAGDRCPNCGRHLLSSDEVVRTLLSDGAAALTESAKRWEPQP